MSNYNMDVLKKINAVIRGGGYIAMSRDRWYGLNPLGSDAQLTDAIRYLYTQGYIKEGKQTAAEFADLPATIVGLTPKGKLALLQAG